MTITTIQQKRALSSVWSSVNPVLLAGELGYEIDTKLLKIGDGEHNWNELDYFMQSLITRIQALEEQIAELSEAIEDIDKTASDEDIDAMLDDVFAGNEQLNDGEVDDDFNAMLDEVFGANP